MLPVTPAKGPSKPLITTSQTEQDRVGDKADDMSEAGHHTQAGSGSTAEGIQRDKLQGTAGQEAQKVVSTQCLTALHVSKHDLIACCL